MQKFNNSNQVYEIELYPGLFDDLITSSSFKAFLLQCSKLQKVEIHGLNVDEKTLFFVNIYNLLTMHAIISKGIPGNTPFSRATYMRNAKYNIGDMVFSLVDIEHGILRHCSSKAQIVGPVVYSINFSDKDPRSDLVLEVPKPNISFCCYTASVGCPPLTVLLNRDNIDEEMKKNSQNFVARSIVINSAKLTILLPSIFNTYWVDFGGNKLRVMKWLQWVLEGTEPGKEIEDILKNGELYKNIKINFSPYDWTPVLVLNNK